MCEQLVYKGNITLHHRVPDNNETMTVGNVSPATAKKVA
ncbi:hypothetical protein BTN50_1265 [Candidatus Enterovibrio altilux]|uniref:Uncharacterized protein n=1 Tax=Candidatus Enterovibrio altilux TaxID=1927128 RepID=A0A291B9T9_9GAMM|nr:hypothetical protein BTN50_1265 [Candidatus Enterovibrio luxaltus]